MNLNFDIIYPALPYILGGVGVTLKFTLTSLVCGLPLGIILGGIKSVDLRDLSRPIARRAIKISQKIAQAYTSLFRGTPLLVQLGFVFFATPQLTGYSITAFEAGVITFSLNSAAYASEIIRGGVQSIDRGQWEASQILGLSYFQTLYFIILPQAFRVILPSLINELVDLLKESALVSTIGEADLLRRAQLVAGEHYLYFEPLLCAAIGYYVLILGVTFVARKVEKRMRYA